MATMVQMGLPTNGEYPQIKIQDREDAKNLVDILHRNGVSVNLREVPDDLDMPTWKG